MNFYVYFYLRENGTPYYVGKGSGDRAFCTDRRLPAPKDRSRILIQEYESETDAFAAEIFFIAFYGRKDTGVGCLHNFTDGGQGAAGHKHSAEVRERIRRGIRKSRFPNAPYFEDEL